ncbi:MAG: phosphoribosyltransferase [Alphaproteobacteria bacterium]
MTILINRKEAGKKLADKLHNFKNKENTIILALPRGGVPVASEISKELNLPLDLLLVRKLGLPEHEELAFGAIAIGNKIIFNDEILRKYNLSQEVINEIIEKERHELNRRKNLYRKDQSELNLQGKTVILVDDGIATGATISIALAALEAYETANIIIAAPVICKWTYDELKNKFNKIFYLICPNELLSISQFYQEFTPVSDEEVINLLQQSHMQYES